MNVNELEALKDNKEFLTKLGSANTEAEQVALFKEYGIDVSEEVMALVNKKVAAGEELSESDLDAVAGGVLAELCVLAFLIGLSRGLRC